jgi:hypothetical protein
MARDPAKPGVYDREAPVMGILRDPLRFVEALKLPPGYSVCELGDQIITYTEHELSKTWHERHGCGRYVSLDGNGRATHVADLNRSLAKQRIELGTFDLVTDFGTGEHIFNQAQVWSTIHELTKPGGWIVFDRPTSGYPGHGYILIDECLPRDLAHANGYEVKELAPGRTGRGTLIRGVFRKVNGDRFRMPQQGRYHKILGPIMGPR